MRFRVPQVYTTAGANFGSYPVKFQGIIRE